MMTDSLIVLDLNGTLLRKARHQSLKSIVDRLKKNGYSVVTNNTLPVVSGSNCSDSLEIYPMKGAQVILRPGIRQLAQLLNRESETIDYGFWTTNSPKEAIQLDEILSKMVGFSKRRFLYTWKDCRIKGKKDLNIFRTKAYETGFEMDLSNVVLVDDSKMKALDEHQSNLIQISEFHPMVNFQKDDDNGLCRLTSFLESMIEAKKTQGISFVDYLTNNSFY